MSNENFKVEKKTTECYQIRSIKNSLWADINLDCGDKSGRIQIASDFGSWQNYWGACGSSFKEFLTGLDMHYTAGKFGAAKWFDLNATLSGLESRINEVDSDEEKEELKKELEELRRVDGQNEFFHEVQLCDKIMEMENHSPDIHYNVDPLFKRFWNELWPVFIAELKNEVK